MTRTKNKPVAVIISDIHFNINTLEVADTALFKAISHANRLVTPLLVSGDLHDTKANMRGECVLALINAFSLCKQAPYILRGNHDSINEKSKEHSLEFLKPYAHIIKDYETTCLDGVNRVHFIAYQHDINAFHNYIEQVPQGATVFMHQGVIGSLAGHYIQDKSAIPKEWLAGRRVISGHYHNRQDIELPEGGLLSYVGNPYTLGFGEANDPEKGYQILYEDGSLEFVPTNLRKHRIITVGWGTKDTVFREEFFWGPIIKIDETDILWIKMEGPSDKLAIVSKEWLRKQFSIPVADFRLDLIPTETKSIGKTDNNAPQTEVLDSIIENLTNTDDDRKSRLKQLWRQLV